MLKIGNTHTWKDAWIRAQLKNYGIRPPGKANVFDARVKLVKSVSEGTVNFLKRLSKDRKLLVE